MASLKRIWTLSLACGTVLLCGRAMAQIAPGTGNNGPIAFDGEKAERYDNEHKTVWRGGPSGAVNVTQNGARLVTDTLTIYTYAPGEGPNAQPAAGAKPTPGAKGAAAPGQDDTTTSSIKQMVADGHVFYVTQNETARGERGVYDAEPDTITLTGNVIVVQGKNVVRGDKMVIDRKTGQTIFIADAAGRNNPNRVRAVIYNDNQNDQSQSSPAPQAQGSQGQKSQGQPSQGQTTTKPPAAAAKKP
jgi:lipopolysaccharide export system protein LptA